MYPGIDATYYFNPAGQLEVDFVVLPGADADCIELAVPDGRKVAVDEVGSVRIGTGSGEFTLHKPVGLVRNGASADTVECRYVLSGDNRIQFGIERILTEGDTLVIDPVLTFSTYFGGASTDVFYGVAVDGSGNMFMSGMTTSTDYYVHDTIAPHGGHLMGNPPPRTPSDAVVTKISAGGDLVLWSTYLGSTHQDEGRELALDQNLNVYVTGWTNSSYTQGNDFPGTTNASYGDTDVFLAKLSYTGQLATGYNRYFGGSGSDVPSSIAVTPSGKAFIVGGTTSNDLPGSAVGYGTPFQSSYSGNIDGFVASFNVYGGGGYRTYLGGSNIDVVTRLTLTGDTAWVTGYTWSSNFAKTDPGTLPGLHGSYQGNIDGFAMAINPLGTNYVYATFIGAGGADMAYGLALTPDGACWVTGETSSSPFEPTPINSYDAIHGGGGAKDAFVEKLSHNLDTVLAWTYLGGLLYDAGIDIAPADFGSVYIAGVTSTNTPSSFPPVYPLKDLAHSFDGSVYGGGVLDGFISQLSSEGARLHFFTYLGGNRADTAENIAFGNRGDAYVVGRTGSNTKFPVVPGGQSYHTDALTGTWDGFVVKCKCCIGMAGNVDNDSDDGVDISDISFLIDYLWISFNTPACYDESNTDGLPGIDIGDITDLIDFLYISLEPLHNCPQ